ncbi:GNAT family N-acetyltransferase [Paenibacillus sp. FJAT-27812]|uniref:GNAT family N-acetyltransferase n=1 Tax=Paenibacillus sp. FJAT-27812 TaxID=1684143 RepID=UPI0006A7CEAA|nr:GNAT family N-acetyltransferase [Paenibacillus sp. FJAT-27812]
MNIRIAEQHHRQAIVECVNAAYNQYIDRIGKRPAPMLADYIELVSNNFVYIVTDRDELIGLIVLIPKDNYLLIENIAVHPTFQGQGIGRKLIEFAMSFAKEALFQEVRLYTNEVMTENLAYYPKLGFIELERRTEDGYRRVYMSKPL